MPRDQISPLNLPLSGDREQENGMSCDRPKYLKNREKRQGLTGCLGRGSVPPRASVNFKFQVAGLFFDPLLRFFHFRSRTFTKLLRPWHYFFTQKLLCFLLNPGIDCRPLGDHKERPVQDPHPAFRRPGRGRRGQRPVPVGRPPGRPWSRRVGAPPSIISASAISAFAAATAPRSQHSRELADRNAAGRPPAAFSTPCWSVHLRVCRSRPFEINRRGAPFWRYFCAPRKFFRPGR